ncbi:MAG: hypothetical protein JST_000260 [Candidatus Parcubacteria bacterium]|nr:MAG: hypothetical protein JST_2350 [Candidatus Parcubacteria bacterium]
MSIKKNIPVTAGPAQNNPAPKDSNPGRVKKSEPKFRPRSAPQPTRRPVFSAHPVPTKEQVKKFEQAVRREARQEEIEDNLSEIYRDKKGELVDVSEFKARKKPILILLLKNIFVLAVIASLAYAAFTYFFSPNANEARVSLEITAPDKVKAGEPFNYSIVYENRSEFFLKNLRLELKYPERFIREEVSGELTPLGSAGNYFELPDLPIGGRAEIKISGRLIGKQDSTNILTAGLSFAPQDFSSQFKEEAVSAITISSLGFDLGFEYSNAVLVGQENEIELNFSRPNDTFLENFDLSFSFPENISLVNATTTATNTPITVDKSNLVWRIENFATATDDYRLPVRYKVNRKVSDSQDLIIRLSQKDEKGQEYVFLEKVINLSIMTSNLNLTLSVNGNKTEGAASFGETLKYSLSYVNKSDNDLQDIVLMAVLDGDWLDWKSIKETDGGKIKNNTIIWAKEELPALATLEPGASGELNFEIAIQDYTPDKLGDKTTIASYAYFTLGSQSTGLNDSKSNTVTTKINSDFQFTEQVLYFDENNMPVGSGPLPPVVGQETGVRVYWNLENNLNELKGARVVAVLPEYVNFAGARNTSWGSLSFDPGTRFVNWELGDLPLSTYQAQAQFDLTLTPTEDQRNTLLVILPGSTAQALDAETGIMLTASTPAKTTKLEDDSIAALSNSGLVQ